MADENAPMPKVEFSDAERSNNSSRKTKVAAISVTVTFLLGAVVSLVVVFSLEKATPNARLVEVNLKEGETLTYQVDKDIEVHVGEIQKGTFRAIVGIRVLNKTSEEYWFLMKFNLSHVGGNVDIKGVQIMTDYFLVRLQLHSKTPNYGAGESVEVYGSNSTDEEQLRLVFSILQQLLPTVKRDLYVKVDGQKVADSKPEESPLLPGSVKMNREANTSDKDAVFIKNHFNHLDFVNMSSEIDLHMKYSDFASINKNNGMISESHAHFSGQLHLGELTHSKGGFDVTVMKITLKSHVSLIETDYFGYAESEADKFHLFVKLVVPKTAAILSVDEDPAETPSNVSLSSQQNNSTNSSLVPLSRVRRGNSVVAQVWQKAGPTKLSVIHPVTLFQKKVLGIKIKGTAHVSVKDEKELQIEVEGKLAIGSKSFTVFSKTYKQNQLEEGKEIHEGRQWKKKIPISVSVFFLKLGVDFSLTIRVEYKLSFPPEGNSLIPPQLAVKIEPFAEVTASIEGYISAYILRAGVYGDGELMLIGLPLTLSYYEGKWCLTLNARLTALELSAGIFYQRRKFSWRRLFYWAEKKILYEFETRAAINEFWTLPEKCTSHTS